MKKEVIAHKDPKSPISEIFRSLRTNIQFMNSNKGLKTILVTSTLQSEGKSWITANLAVTFAQAGKRVVILDSDMRKGRQYNIFSVEPLPGLSNYLSGIDENGEDANDNILSYIKETEIDNLYIIPAGNVPPNPSELLVSEKTTKMIDILKELYDIVIFDGTPSVLVTDAVILSRVVDTTIIVTTHKETKIDNLQKIKKSIENVGGNIAGVIINRVPISAKKYEDRYYYGSNKLKNEKVTKKEKTIKIKEELEVKGIIKDQKIYDTAKEIIENKDQKIEEIIKDKEIQQTAKVVNEKVKLENIAEIEQVEKIIEKKLIPEDTFKIQEDEILLEVTKDIESKEVSEEKAIETKENINKSIENTNEYNLEENIRIPEIGIINTEVISVENPEEILLQMKKYLSYEKVRQKKGDDND